MRRDRTAVGAGGTVGVLGVVEADLGAETAIVAVAATLTSRPRVGGSPRGPG